MSYNFWRISCISNDFLKYFVANDDDDQDNGGHGTACAGIAAGIGNNGLGVAGVAYNAKILPIRIINDYGFSANVANGIDVEGRC